MARVALGLLALPGLWWALRAAALFDIIAFTDQETAPRAPAVISG